MKRSRFYRLVMGSNGKIFSVLFKKRSTGEIRKMNCRINVKKHLKGGVRAYDPAEHNLIFVYDLVKKGYRAISVEGVFKFKYGGKVYDVVD